MGRFALVSVAVLVGATACGSATTLRSAIPLRDVLVYARPDALTYAAYNKPYTIWRARLDGSHAERLAAGDFPAVSRDGRWVAFERGAGIFVIPAAGGVAKRAYTLGGIGKGVGLEAAPTWAPDSRHFGIQSYDGIVVVDAIHREAHRLPSDASSFAFSPDSHKIAYSVDDGDADDGLFVVPIRGGTPTRLADKNSGNPVWGQPGIAFFRRDRRGGDIWLSDGRTHHVRQLTHTGDGSLPGFFSADGKELLAWYPPSHNGRLWAVDLATGAERPLTPWVDLTPHGLSADGKTVLAVLGCDGNGALYGSVETIPFAGGKPHIIVNGPCSASWNAG